MSDGELRVKRAKELQKEAEKRGEVRWAPGYTEEQIQDAIKRGIDEPKGLEYEQWLMEVVPLGDEEELGILYSSTDDDLYEDVEVRWAPGYTEEQILDAIGRGIDEPKGIEYEQWLKEVVPLGDIHKPGILYGTEKKKKEEPKKVDPKPVKKEEPKKVEPKPVKKDKPKKKKPVPKDLPIPKKTPVEPIKIDEKELNERITDMLDKYYGDSDKKTEYKDRMARYKSHVIDKDGIKTVEDYKYREQDEKFLQLEEYGTRIERFSRAEKGDMSAYEKLVENYKLAGVVLTDSDGEELTDEEAIKMFRMQDEDYIATNNQAYNQHVSTQENLKTLGKHGQKLPFVKMKKVKKEVKGKDGETTTKIDVGAIGSNIGRGIFNGFLAVRNVKAAVNRVIGTYVAAPIHRAMFDSDRVTDGMYKNMRTHRYNARKDYYEQMMIGEYVEKQLEKGVDPEELKNPGLAFGLRLAFKPRFQAIFKAKEGNIAVLSAGAHDIRESMIMIEAEKAQRERRAVEIDEERLVEMAKAFSLHEKYKETKDPEERLGLAVQMMTSEKALMDIDRKAVANAERPVHGVIQTDAISLKNHDKANKENMTKVVTGIKTAARVGVGYYVGKNITRHIEERTHTEITPDVTKTTQEWVEPTYKDGLTTYSADDVEKVTFGDLLKTSDMDVSHHVGGTGGNAVVRPSGDEYLRGIAFTINGKRYSGSDGVGFDITGRTAVQIEPMSEGDNVLDTVARVMTAQGNPMTSQELKTLFTKDPAAYRSFAESLNVWSSRSPEGVATGWLNTSDIMPDLKQVTEKVVDIPGHFIEKTTTIPGKSVTIIDEAAHDVINPAAAVAGAMNGVGGALDAYDTLRRTRSAEELKITGVKKSVMSHQKDNKGSYANRNTNNDWGFEGDDVGDYMSVYNERTLAEGELTDDEVQMLIEAGLLPKDYGIETKEEGRGR